MVPEAQHQKVAGCEFDGGSPRAAVAEEFTVLAKPGESFVFSGTVSSLDVRSGALAVDNHSDDQNYDSL